MLKIYAIEALRGLFVLSCIAAALGFVGVITLMVQP